MAETPDTFAAAIALIGMAVDPKACAKRLDELRQALEKAEAATAKLTADREQHAATVAAAKDEIAARTAQLLKREVAVGIAERDLVKREKAIKDAMPSRFSADPTGAPGSISHSGLAREAYYG
jgi:uncharacterized protein (DUF3084 family)